MDRTEKMTPSAADAVRDAAHTVSAGDAAGRGEAAPEGVCGPSLVNGTGQILLPEMLGRRSRGIVYGPVFSRRFGHSLGIDVLPPGAKRCPFDCVYCEVGSAAPCDRVSEGDRFPPTEAVLQELEIALHQAGDLDAVTFAGSGEPTLHPRFDELVDGVARLRDRHCPNAGVVVLSNGALLDRRAVRDGLERADVRVMKLDAGDQRTFQDVNRPAASVRLERIADNLRRLDDIVVQTLLLDGVVSNVGAESQAAYVDALCAIEPISIQLYSVSRAAPVVGVREVPHRQLLDIARSIRCTTGIPVEVF